MTKRLLVCDLDNTLYDWVRYFVTSFYAMVDSTVAITGCDRDQLLDDFRAVHQRHHDSEFPFALLETQTIRRLYHKQPRTQLFSTLAPAFQAFNASRKISLVLFPDVYSTLELLERFEIKLIAHTESNLFAAVDRLRRLNLTRFFSHIYCHQRPRSLHPFKESNDKWLLNFPLEKVSELQHHQRKPNPDVLLEICSRENIDPKDAAYIGDSIARDVFMAKKSGVLAVWAKYGANHIPGDYARLVRVSHWTSEDVERELRLKSESESIRPDVVAESSFREVVTALGLPIADSMQI